ncbi:MAG TPA: hypothetical protein VED46_18905 [Alphaproteobacteria bacterium]|nr:hypothetical protein [Alphaproteobacteria bacterium]
MPARADGERRLIRLGDVSLLLLLLGLWPIAWLLPERLWPDAVNAILPIVQKSGKARARLAHIQNVLQDRSHRSRQIDEESARNWLLKQLQLLRAYRPGGWRPKITVDGHEHIDAALARGCGVILWTPPFCFNEFISKIGLREAGFRLTHVVIPTHGWSNTHFGVRVLNPQWTRIEKRYLERQIVISDGNWGQAKSDPRPHGIHLFSATRPSISRDTVPVSFSLSAIRQVLRGNGVVLIAARKGAARRPATIRLLNARFPLGLGPAVLAYDCGAALIPVYTLRESVDSYRVVVDPALPIRRDLARYEAALDAAQKLAARLEHHIRAHPGQWNWWETMRDSTNEAGQSLDMRAERNEVDRLTATSG